MPQQFVYDPQYRSSLDGLTENLAENVRYRRAQQQRKAAQRDALEQKMAAGLVPEAEITVTDEGMQFEGEGSVLEDVTGVRDPSATNDARRQWLAEVGGMFGDQDRSQKAENLQTTELVNDASAEAEAGLAKAQQERLNNPAVGEMKGNVPVLAAGQKVLAGQSVGTDPTPSPTLPSQPTPPTSDVSPPSGDRTEVLKEMFADAADRAGMPKPDPTAPAAATPDPSPNKRASASIADSYGDAGSIALGVEEGGAEASVDQLARTTTQKKSEIIDETRTSLKNLSGLAFLEQMNNNAANTAGYNNFQDTTFEKLRERRAQKLDQWEKSLSGDGISQNIEKVGNVTLKEGKSKYNATVSHRDYGSTRQNMNIGNTRSGAGDKPGQRTLGLLKGTEGVDYEIRNDGAYWKPGSVTAQDIANDFLQPGTNNIRLVTTKSGDRGLLDAYTGMMDPSINAEAKDMTLEAYSGSGEPVYYKNRKWVTKSGRAAKEPTALRHIKLYKNGQSTPLVAFTQTSVSVNSEIHERWLSPALSGARGGTTPKVNN